MTNEELYEALQKNFEAIDKRFEGIENRLEKIEEDVEVTRSGVNALIEWAENVSNAITFPLPKL